MEKPMLRIIRSSEVKHINSHYLKGKGRLYAVWIFSFLCVHFEWT
jgi:hypothetical protein